MSRHNGAINSPEAAFRLGYDEGDERRLGLSAGGPATDAQRRAPEPVHRTEFGGFEEEWERGYRAGLRGEPSPTTVS